MEVDFPPINDAIAFLSLTQCLTRIADPAIIVGIIVKRIRSKPTRLTSRARLVGSTWVDQGWDVVRIARASKTIEFRDPIFRGSVQVFLGIRIVLMRFDYTISVDIEAISAAKCQIAASVAVNQAITAVQRVERHAIPDV